MSLDVHICKTFNCAVLGFMAEKVCKLLTYCEETKTYLSINSNSWFTFTEDSAVAAFVKKHSRCIIGPELILACLKNDNSCKLEVFKWVLDMQPMKTVTCVIESPDWQYGEIIVGISNFHVLMVVQCPPTTSPTGVTEQSTCCCFIWELGKCEQPLGANRIFVAHAIEQLSIGHGHALALADGGLRVLSWGYNTRGELGHGNNCIKTNSFDPIFLLDGLHFSQVCAGGWHSCALTENGDVYFWGWNEHGQLGFDPHTYGSVCFEPILLNLYENEEDQTNFLTVKQTALGARHSVLLDEGAHVWTFGWNRYGQCCNNCHCGFDGFEGESVHKEDCVPNNWKPRVLDRTVFRNIKAISAGPWTTICLF